MIIKLNNINNIELNSDPGAGHQLLNLIKWN